MKHPTIYDKKKANYTYNKRTETINSTINEHKQTQNQNQKKRLFYINEDEKRKNFLERNRQAALKCRQRKKQWLNNLQTRVEYLTIDNERLQLQNNMLRDEVMNLRNVLSTHNKECHLNEILIQSSQQNMGYDNPMFIT
ncbi:hypothetical protein BDB01DRAFT_719438 [Pilobolus umbonatus]|nr:hypothetical protein BDB01DRAFT_719438 [Pilobolus umbonatus]